MICPETIQALIEQGFGMSHDLNKAALTIDMRLSVDIPYNEMHNPELVARHLRKMQPRPWPIPDPVQASLEGRHEFLSKLIALVYPSRAGEVIDLNELLVDIALGLDQ